MSALLSPLFGQLAALDSVVANLQSVYETTIQLFTRFDVFADWNHVATVLKQLSGMWATTLLVLGLLTLVKGYRWRRVFVMVMSILLGSFAGYLIGQKFQAPMLMAVCFGALAGVLSWPLMKYAIAAVGGLLGAFLGANLWAAVDQAAHLGLPEQSYWVGALVGLVSMGLLAFVVAKLSLVVSTSVSGATMAALGALALLLSHTNLSATLDSTFSGPGSAVLPLVILIAAIIGLVIQEVDWSNVKSDPAATK